MAIKLSTRANVTRRLIQKDGHVVRLMVKCDKNWDEWKVEYWLDGKLHEGRTTPCADKDDAVETMHVIFDRINSGVEKI